MAQPEMIKGLIKPPFATYDIVVYFGCGIFALPILHSYVGGPVGTRAPPGAMSLFGVAFVDTAIAALFLLFSVYVLGHLIAYVASEFIERAFEMIFGKTSSSLLAFDPRQGTLGKREINRLISANLRTALSRGARFPTLVRLGFHGPVLLVYLLISRIGIYGYWRTRVPAYVIAKVREKVSRLDLGEVEVRIDSAWYKLLEHYVLNRMPNAVPRMYNYLIISGLFRSLSFIFLLALWGETFVMIEAAFDGTFATPNLFFYMDNWLTRAVGFGFLVVTYVFCACAYLKFQRRYVEEAVFAFVLEPPSGNGDRHPD